MASFQDWLARVNARYGGVGAVITATVCLGSLVYGIVVILGDFW